MKEAMYYKKLADEKVRCYLCAHHCTIHQGKRGICGVRINKNGTLYSLVYGKLVSLNIDPIEKKPLFHFYPASSSFSIATVGCNFKCKHCQNYEISQYQHAHDDVPGENVSPEQVVDSADQTGCKSISYTYTEPTIFFEFADECARLAHIRGIKNVFVSNGYMGPEAARTIAPYLDAVNIDLKGGDEFYKKICGARLRPVTETIQLMKELGIWVELTTLLIPSFNDSNEDLDAIIEFIHSVDPGIPWHVSQFYPTFELLDLPRTPVETLKRAREKGFQKGLKYVYEGNVPREGAENTYCHNCNEILVERFGYRIINNSMKNGDCFKCHEKVDGIWR
jgi:pyruvate formate lyase activating enzyme